MGKTDRFASFGPLLRAYVMDQANGCRPEGREVDSITMNRHCGDFWTVKVTYKDRPDAKPRKGNWLVKAGLDAATFDIYVEEVVGWSWIQTQLQIKALNEKASA
ncbi:hypothetical protein [Pseudomonas sp. PLMAX]|uniref:hypothetical protein n=1 Tax=Pseudomonas sp. PLMAX TaxID=2201998 RepID=UPI0038BA9763